jgi:beta-lactamase regulating signal transducer with metallopeptidase domain
VTSLIDGLNSSGGAWWRLALHVTWQASLLALVALALVRVGRRWPSPLRYWLLVVALAKFIMPPMLAAPTGLFSHFGPARPAPPERERRSLASVSLGWERRDDAAAAHRVASDQEDGESDRTQQTPNAGVAGEPADAQSGPAPTATPAASPAASRTARAPRLTWKGAVLLVYLVGLVAVAAWTAVQFVRLRRLVRRSTVAADEQLDLSFLALCRRMSLAHMPRLHVSADETAPMVVGVLRPILVIPSSLTGARFKEGMRSVLMHEIAHVRRKDTWLNCFQIVVSVIWWFNPLVWVLNGAIRRVREDCCDDVVLSYGTSGNGDYCGVLLHAASNLAIRKSAGARLGFADRLHPLGQRLGRIMDGTLRRAAALRPWGVALVVIAALAMLPGLSYRDPVSSDVDRTVFVSADAGNDDYDGLTARYDGVHGPRATIQAGIDAARDGDTVLIAKGIYSGVGNRDIDLRGKRIGVRSADGPEHTVIDCQRLGRGFVFHTQETNESILDGVTIRNALGSGSGGGIYCHQSSPTITDCTITDCEASGYGPGVFCGPGNPRIIRCVITQCIDDSVGPGGGIACRESDVLIDGCTVSDNALVGIWLWVTTARIRNCTVARNSDGGIRCDRGEVTIADCMVANNTLDDQSGGGIRSDHARLTVERCTIRGNRTTYDPEATRGFRFACEGGGVMCDTSEVDIRDCSIVDNIAPDGGGLALLSFTKGSVSNCLIAGNTAEKLHPVCHGGGVLIEHGANAEIVNCAIIGNEARQGGGVAFHWGHSTIRHCTIAGNTAEAGGGIYGHDRSEMTMTNSILWGNTADAGAEVVLVGSMDLGPEPKIVYPDGSEVTLRNRKYEPTLTLIHCDVDRSENAVHCDEHGKLVWGEGNISADPLLVDGYRLSSQSPCIDAAGDSPTATDIDGDARPFDVPGVDGNGPLPESDIGADEFNGTDTSTTDARVSAPLHG